MLPVLCLQDGLSEDSYTHKQVIPLTFICASESPVASPASFSTALQPLRYVYADIETFVQV